MSRIRKFLALSAVQRWTLAKAAILLGTVRMLLWILPYPTARRLLDFPGRRAERLAADPAPPEDLAWAVGVAAGLVPGGSHCLSQAMALELLLIRRGYPCQVCFGVRRGSEKDIAAHAWLEHNGVVLIGGGALHRFVKLTSPTDSPS
jgi:hypothetical protein